MKNGIKKFLSVILTFSLAFPLGNNSCSADDSEQENMVSSKISVVWDKTKNVLNEAWNSAACNATKNALRTGWEFTEEKSGIYWNKFKSFCEKNWRWFNDEFMRSHPVIAVVIIAQVANVSIETALSVVTLLLSPLFRNRHFRNLAEKINKVIGTNLITNLPTTESIKKLATGEALAKVATDISNFATTSDQLKIASTSINLVASNLQLHAEAVGKLVTKDEFNDAITTLYNDFIGKIDELNGVIQQIADKLPSVIPPSNN